MSLRKKIVFLPYDFDTALGINNEGELVFSYNLEDVDHLQSGADVYNGQQSVLWKNLRAAFDDDIRTMYQSLRSSGALSYSKVEEMFETHQDKWGEAIFNEDAWFKYLAPLIEDSNGAYLSMLQGSKAEQRKWWMYNRFRYIDSKYNAGDALTDYITVRGYSPADITVTPYADIYAAVKFGSTLVQGRAPRNIPYTLACPSDNINDTETMIFSASQLKSVGDLAPYKIGFGDFRAGTKLQSIKVGDADSNYSNGNLNTLTLGNNGLLRTLDVRNCPNLTGAIDVSHCTNIEHVYFEGTAITGISLPDGGILKTLHLPSTVTNLTIMNQRQLTDLTVPDCSNISTLRLENVNSAVDARDILADMVEGSRVRLIGFNWDCADYNEIKNLYDLFDTMRGLDVNGDTTEHIQLSGIINIEYITDSKYTQLTNRYPSITINAGHITEDLFAVNWCKNDGTLIYTGYYRYGQTPTYNGATPTNTDPESEYQTFQRWKPAIAPVTDDVTYTASFIPYYTVTFKDGNTTLQTVTGVDKGSSAVYTGAAPTKTNYEFVGWSPEPTNIQGNTTCSAVFVYTNVPETITDSWDEIIESVGNGTFIYKYNLGDTKKLHVGTDWIVSMQLIAINTDELYGQEGVAATTWLAVHRLKQKYAKSSDYNWATSDLRNYIRTTIKSLIPENVRNAVKDVSKTSKNDGGSGILTTSDDFWIPSAKELGISDGGDGNGPVYDRSNYSVIIKEPSTNNNIGNYWVRGGNNLSINGGGRLVGYQPTDLNHIRLGFCI